MKNIFLIGFMGTGKSTVARYLNREFAMEIIEMDELIVKLEGKSIPDIFSERGEEYFRDLETKLLTEIQKKENVVVSCGGGAVLREENVQIMKQSGHIVLLAARPETILERVKRDDSRPLLKGRKNVKEIGVLMEARREKYEAAAVIVICVDDKNAEQIGKEIMQKMTEQNKKIILASASPRRREIMRQAGYRFEIMVSHKEEVYHSSEPAEIVQELSLLKAEDIAERVEQKNVVIIGADTVVAHNGRILGKPKDYDDAFSMIDSIQGETHYVYTGVTVISFDESGERTVVNDAVGTKVFVDPMTEEEIHAYLGTGEHKDKAGSYAIQGRFAPYIEIGRASCRERVFYSV